MATHARQQYFADEVSLQKDSREFSIADEVQQKIDGIEEGAQVNVIETVKVNGEPLTPDEDKAVDITVPGVIDNLYSTSVSDALSARQGKVLYDYLQNIASRGRYLSNWNCATGLAMTNPEESPYEYKAGDYYTVSDVAASGGTNYRPDGSEYIIGQASTVVETEDVSVSDLYLYDGTNWLLLSNSGRAIAVDSSLSTTSTNPVENRVITNALNGKADATDTNTKTFYLSNIDDLTTAQAAYDWYTAGKNPIIMYGNSAFMMYRANASTLTFRNDEYTVGAYDSQKSGIKNRYIEFQLSNGTVTSIRDNWIWLGNPFLDTYTNYSIPYTPLYDGSPATKKYVDDHAGTTYTAGANVQISAQNVISATDTKYTAGTGISIDANNVISNTQTSAEWGNITGTLSNQTDLQNALDGKVNLGLNKVFDSTTVEIGKWVDEGGMQGSGHHVTIDPNGEVSAYNVTSGGYNEAKLGTDGLTLLENSALGGDETTVISQDGITITEGQTTQTYNFLGNDRIAKLSDVSGVVADVNTKTFRLFFTSQLNVGQEIYDWYSAGKYPIIYFISTQNSQAQAYEFYGVGSNQIIFAATPRKDATNIKTDYKIPTLTISYSSGTVTSITESSVAINVLETNIDYSSPYTPQYNGSPATKKYVDDNVVQKSATAPSSPTEGMVWYDTTNDKLKAYDGTNWNEVGAGDMNYADFNWQAKTGATVTLDLASTVTPESNFTINAPSTIKDGQTYILRVNNGATAYTMTLGTNITNPYQESTLLTADGIDQFVFLAIGGNLELQPQAGSPIEEYVESINGNSGAVTLKTVNSTSIVGSGNISVQSTLSNITAAQIKTGTATTQRTVTAAALAGGLVRISDAANNILANGGKLWAGTQEDYEALTSYDEDTVYLTI